MTDQTIIHVEQGKYAIGVEALKKDTDEASAMANYLSKMAIITKQEAFLSLSILLQSQQTITGFQIKNHLGEFIEAIDSQIDEKMDRRFEMFELKTLPANLYAQVQYEIEHEGKSFKGDEILKLTFDQNTLEKVD